MIKSNRLILSPLELSDINDTYLGWMNDPDVNLYLEPRATSYTLASLHEYWQEHHDNPNSPWFAIRLASDYSHIGNIKVGPISWHHKRADIGLLIGDKKCWGKGYATEAIRMVSTWSFVDLSLEKLSCIINSDNIGSRRAFEKVGFLLEGTFRDEWFYSGKRVDSLRLGLTRSDWKQLIK